MAPILGYLPIRGLAQPIRYLLHYTGTEYEEKIYKYASPPDHEKKYWLQEKFNLGLDFPNLPYYIEGDLKITQSAAILRYLARKHGLVATSEQDRFKQEVVEQQAVDLRFGMVMLCYNNNFEKAKVDYIQNLPSKLKMLSDYLGKKQWIMGDKLTYVDFILYEAIDFQLFLVPDCLEKFPNLKEYLRRFENLPPIASYMKSGSYVKWPILSPSASFGGK